MHSFNKKIFWLKKSKRKLADFFVWVKKRFFKNSKQAQNDWEWKLVSSLSRSKVPNLRQIKYVKKFLTSRELWIIRVLVLVIILNLVYLGFNFYQNNLEVVPKQEGTYVEGLIGNPQYINPLYASINDVDGDIAGLVFSGLFKLDSDKGIRKDLVEDYQVNQAKDRYSLSLKKGVKWHSGEDLTADDVIFTFKAIKDPEYNSPLRSKFSGVEISKTGSHKIEFLLPGPDPYFLADLRFGIIPKFLWSEIIPNSARLAELNLKPIGSGPYKFKSLIKDKYGNILDYKLALNKKYYDKEPYIEDLEFKFFVNAEEAVNALNTNKVDGLGYLPRHNLSDLVAQESLNIRKMELPQVNSLFFHAENNPALENLGIRRALNLAINKERLISKVLGPTGKREASPLPEFSFYHNNEVDEYAFNLTEAEKKLEEQDWTLTDITEEEVAEIRKIQESSATTSTSSEEQEEGEDEAGKTLSISQKNKLALGAGKWRAKEDSEEKKYLIVELTYPDRETYAQMAEMIQGYWEEIGIKTILRPVAVENLEERVLVDRNFQALLYAQVFDIYPDLYSFWHSGEAESGLNIGAYKNETVDKLLQEARKLEPYSRKKKEKYLEAQKIITSEVPAIFIYTPYYNYIQSKQIKGFQAGRIYSSSDRFLGISDWYLKTGKKIKW